MTLRRIVLASGNADKLRELAALITPLQFEVVPQPALGVASADEPHLTFVENALAKARHASLATGWGSLADDSGLCVDALNGAPGVRSARFAASADQPADDGRNNVELLRRLAGVENRHAHFTCVLAAVRRADDPEPLIVDARWHGEIVDAPRGHNGFGYDPLFFVREFGKTAAELDPEHKNRISHRGLAFAALVRKLADWR